LRTWIQKSMKKQHGVLSDHKRIGKRFIPPLLQLQAFTEVSWRDQGLPELLWIGLLNDEYGHSKGTELALAVARACTQVVKQPSPTIFAFTSAYATLSTILGKISPL
jgi:hypothetical protein